MDIAAWVILIARYTGWGRDFILWELSIAEGNAYVHAILRLNNVKTRWVNDREEDRLFEDI